MRVPRIYISTALNEQHTIEIDGAAFLHLRDVLRIKTEQTIQLFNGDGFDYVSQIRQINKRTILAEIQQKLENRSESNASIHLLISICKGDRFDLSLQKSTELGVNEITPIYTKRTKLIYPTNKLENKTRHWQRIIENACEQCGRSCLPKLHAPKEFSTFVTTSTFSGLKFIADHSGSAFCDSDKDNKKLICAIGPESGFSEQELELARQHQFKIRKMGNRILRAETAAITAMTILQYKFGDLGKPSIPD